MLEKKKKGSTPRAAGILVDMTACLYIPTQPAPLPMYKLLDGCLHKTARPGLASQPITGTCIIYNKPMPTGTKLELLFDAVAPKAWHVLPAR